MAPRRTPFAFGRDVAAAAKPRRVQTARWFRWAAHALPVAWLCMGAVTAHAQGLAGIDRWTTKSSCLAALAADEPLNQQLAFGDAATPNAYCTCLAEQAAALPLHSTVVEAGQPPPQLSVMLSQAYGCLSTVLAKRKAPVLTQEEPLFARMVHLTVTAVDRSGAFKPAKMKLGGSCSAPEYPPPAIRANAQGTTMLAYRVSAGGKVLDARVVQSAGTTQPHKLLDSTALIAMMPCLFEPAEQSGKPVESWTPMEYQWVLK